MKGPPFHGLVLALAIAAQLSPSQKARAQDTTLSTATHDQPEPAHDSVGGPYFYRGLPYGSDAYMGPLAVFLNKGYAVSVFESSNRKVLGPYGWKSVGDALTHPVAAVERGGGWWEFLRHEVLPLTFTKHDARWITNYLGHTFEGGIYYRRLTEWYPAKGWPAPALLAGATTLSAALWNELYETRGREVGGAGTVADSYLFDLAGVALFSFDAVPRFFARKLHANVWVGQASLLLPSGEIANNTNLMYLKVPWKVVPSSSVCLWAGIGSMAGLTFHRRNGLDISVGLGVDTEQRNVDPVTGGESVELASAAGLFVDRNGSLLATLDLSEVRHRMLRVNVYPGILPGFVRQFGAWAILRRDLRLSLGLSHLWLGAGLGRAVERGKRSRGCGRGQPDRRALRYPALAWFRPLPRHLGDAVRQRASRFGSVDISYVESTVRGPTGTEADVRFLIDSGAAYSLLPDAVWKAIGLSPKREMQFSLADGTTVRRAVSECHFTLPQGEGHSPVVLGEPHDPEPLLGLVTLEVLGLVFDPFRRTLHPMRALLV